MLMADSTACPQVLLCLANLGLPRRPSGAPVAYADPILPDATVASLQLAEVVDQPVAVVDLADLRRLQRAAVAAAEAILAREPVDGAELNALAAGSRARVEVVMTDGAPRQHLEWTDTSPAAALARRLIGELDGLDSGRLRRCARPECDLFLYDTTRSRTRRWHAEDPCGWRERQRVHRQKASRPTRADRT
jgi:predicted RNA-binding Zn ribbon-like protein